MAGDSKKLDIVSASVLQTVLEVTICLALAMIAIIFDTGASMSISGELKDFPYGFEKCSAMLQRIGSDLWVKGKSIVCWTFPKVGGGFITIEWFCLGLQTPAHEYPLLSRSLMRDG